MKRPFLTVLTAPIPSAGRRVYQSVRRVVRPFVKPGVPRPIVSPYPGHFALVRSVVDGLRAVHADFNFNPRGVRQLGRTVYAPANEALRQAATLRREGKIEYLAAGPVNAFFPDECDRILHRPEIDRLIVSSDWVVEFYRKEAPELVPKIRVGQAGVDAGYWKPSGLRASARALVYWKSGPETFCEAAEAVVRRCELEPVRVRYGRYDLDVYRRVLDAVVLGVFISSFETQGLALAEAWSMNVPTIVWDPRGEAAWRGRTFRSGSSCPFLGPLTGRSWRTLADLEPVLRNALRTLGEFRPREWILAHMTDAICSAALYRAIQEDVEGFSREPLAQPSV